LSAISSIEERRYERDVFFSKYEKNINLMLNKYNIIAFLLKCTDLSIRSNLIEK